MHSSEADTFAKEEHDRLSAKQCEGQVERVLQSAAFRNASTAQALLRYLANKTILGRADSLKEYTIGVEALGRKENFDPKLDPIVRVQSHRLRTKLREYYGSEGASDQVRIDLPRGRYIVTFEAYPVLPGEQAAPSDLSHQAAEPESPSWQPPVEESAPRLDAGLPSGKPRRVPARLVAILLVAMLVVCAFVAGLRVGGQPLILSRAQHETGDKEVEAFWSRFVGDDSAPVIAYTDATFLLDDSNDLYRYRRGAVDSRGALVDPHLAREFASNPEIVAKAGKLYYDNGYTGTGELESVGMLAELLGYMGLQPTVKSSRDLTPEDLNHHNVILLGSPFQNTGVSQLLTAGDFVYQNPDQHREQWRAQILNVRPRPGEQAAYGTERDPATQALRTDYSLVTVMPGTTPGRLIAVLGGLDTKGTQGATTFATSSVGVSQLNASLRMAGDTTRTQMPPFQALIQVHLVKGYQVLGSNLVSVHVLSPAKSFPDPPRTK